LVLEVLKNNGMNLTEIELPQSPSITFLLSVEAAAAFDELTRSGKDDKMVRQIRNAWPNVFRYSRLVPAVEYINANRLRTQLIQDMDEMLKDKKIDVYITPSWRSSNLSITNLTGHPSVVVPTGFFEGKPTSITFSGKLYEENKVLAVAKFFQEKKIGFYKLPKELR
jgi:Asp-tRNA(Asn)/Glu-tRNA(Gln) amidotransferase A subunit family amidase